MLLKVTVGISFVALLGWCVLELFLKTKEKLFNGKFIYFVYFLISAVIVFGWYWYAEHIIPYIRESIRSMGFGRFGTFHLKKWTQS
jgi:hypothetical protein